jgi:hypothetical protein
VDRESGRDLSARDERKGKRGAKRLEQISGI